MPSANPAVQAFAATFDAETPFGQLLIRRDGDAFTLQHQDDSEVANDNLIPKSREDLRQLVNNEENGQFRPLKSAPNLQRQWIAHASSLTELWDLLNIVYPGAIGDWYDYRTNPTATVSYEDFVGRQSGMYRGAAKLPPERSKSVAKACCADRHCLKTRLWRTASEASVAPSNEPALLCLEPCQILLELARRTFKTSQEPQVNLTLPQSEVESLLQDLDKLAAIPDPQRRTADLASSQNPRRIDLLRQLIGAQFPRQSEEMCE